MTETPVQQPISETGNQTFSVPNTVGDMSKPTDTPVNLSDIVPADYRDRPYLSKIQDIDGLFKAFDNAQSLIGKRGIHIPTETAGEADWNEFYKQLGRPDEASGYELNMPDNLPKELSIDDKQMGEFKEIAHQLGLTPKQAQSLVDFQVKREQSLFESSQKQIQQSQKQVDAEFDKLAANTFGDRADAAIGNAKQLLSKYAPNDFVGDINQLDNKTLIALTSVLDGISKDYISEDSPVRGQSVAAKTQEEMLSEARLLMQSEAFRNPIHVEHETTNKRVQSIYQHLYGNNKR